MILLLSYSAAAADDDNDDRKECEELEADERNLKSKIERRRAELERAEKRIQSLGDRNRPQAAEEVSFSCLLVLTPPSLTHSLTYILSWLIRRQSWRRSLPNIMRCISRNSVTWSTWSRS